MVVQGGLVGEGALSALDVARAGGMGIRAGPADFGLAVKMPRRLDNSLASVFFSGILVTSQ